MHLLEMVADETSLPEEVETKRGMMTSETRHKNHHHHQHHQSFRVTPRVLLPVVPDPQRTVSGPWRAALSNKSQTQGSRNNERATARTPSPVCHAQCLTTRPAASAEAPPTSRLETRADAKPRTKPGPPPTGAETQSLPHRAWISVLWSVDLVTCLAE
ncbi:unnamed protein product [Lampetra fluviatilis]